MIPFIKNLFILPFNVLVTLPFILNFSNNTQLINKYNIYFKIIGILILISGILLFTKTVFLFFKFGNGTIAPWNPPKKFIVRGPYRYVRNPMLIGVNLILISEYLILNSLIIFVWSSIFIVINLLYHKFNEEKKLELRFGNSYIKYKKNVSAWIPRIKPYSNKIKN